MTNYHSQNNKEKNENVYYRINAKSIIDRHTYIDDGGNINEYKTNNSVKTPNNNNNEYNSISSFYLLQRRRLTLCDEQVKEIKLRVRI